MILEEKVTKILKKVMLKLNNVVMWDGMYDSVARKIIKEVKEMHGNEDINVSDEDGGTKRVNGPIKNIRRKQVEKISWEPFTMIVNYG